MREPVEEKLVRDSYAQEHLEIASYELLRRLAEQAGDRATRDVARRILDQEHSAAQRFGELWDARERRCQTTTTPQT
jgi:ferritin-like metal-binding protein YciE